ncbi:MAG: DUF4147 domain-containing protein [Ignavibacteria bacterium]|jgi:hydroxypyruvate reductase
MDESVINKLRRDALDFFRAGIDAATPKEFIPEKINLGNEILTVEDIAGKTTSFDLKNYNRLIVIGAGKASTAMAKELEIILEDRITEGLVVTKYDFVDGLMKIKPLEASHPLPDLKGVKAANALINLCKSAGENDLVINLLSGGSSSLLPYPADNISLEDKIITTTLFLKSGASIKEINTIRKHISGIKGGRLAEHIYPATLINIIISDVINDDLEVIGSGMTVPDSSTFKDCEQIIEKYELSALLPSRALDHIKNGIEGIVEETPKPGNGIFNRVNSFIVCNNLNALSAIKSLAETKGYETRIVNAALDGEAKHLGKDIVKSINQFTSNKSNPRCLLFGGESRVTVKGIGLGGRNQELCLSAAIELDGKEHVVFLSGGTDGNDGPTDAAGAICDGQTILRANQLEMDPLKFLDDNNSYNFFKKLNDLIITGPTNTNVMDLQIILQIS